MRWSTGTNRFWSIAQSFQLMVILFRTSFRSHLISFPPKHVWGKTRSHFVIPFPEIQFITTLVTKFTMSSYLLVAVGSAALFYPFSTEPQLLRGDGIRWWMSSRRLQFAGCKCCSVFADWVNCIQFLVTTCKDGMDQQLSTFTYILLNQWDFQDVILHFGYSDGQDATG